MLSNTLDYDLVAMDGITQLSTAHLRLLAQSGRRLAESLDPAATLAAVAELIVPALADWCVVDLLRDDGTVERAAVAHADPGRADLAERLRRYPPDLARQSGGADALRTGRSELEIAVTDDTIVRISRDADHLALIRALAPVSHIRTPLVARGRVLGSLLLISAESGRHYGAETLALAEELAGRCALALDNARLHAAQEQARERAAALAAERQRLVETERQMLRRAAFLSEASAVLAADLDYAAHPAALARLVVPTLADWCVVDLLGDDGALHRLAAIHADPALQPVADELLRLYPSLAFDTGHTITRVLSSGVPWIDSEVDEARFIREARDPHHLDLLQRLGLVSEMVVPLTVRGRSLGTITMAFAGSGRRHTSEDLALALDLASRAALTLDNARLHAATMASEERFRALFEGTADASFVVDAGWRLVEVNEAAVVLTGYTPTELLSLSVFDLLADPSAADAEIDILVRDGFRRAELELRRKDGTTVPIEGQTTAVDLPNGRIYVSSMRDIGERRAVEQLQQQLLATVTHDLKNPLAGISGHAQILQRRREYAERSVLAILSETRRLGRLIDDLLDVTRAETGRLTISCDWDDLLLAVLAAVEAAQGVSPIHQIELTAPEGPSIAYFDRDRLEQVVQNLLLNAIKYSPQGGPVRVVVREQSNAVEISVADDGIGIAADAIPQLFQRFYRTRAAREQGLPGLGLGLFVTRSLVEAHGGRIWAESAGPGQGSTFSVVVPRRPAPDRLTAHARRTDEPADARAVQPPTATETASA
jgi:PAS domain S-box-containing protein